MHIASPAAQTDAPDAPDIPTPSIAQLLALSLFWFPINMFWTVMLTNFLPVRVEELVGSASKGTYLFYISMLGAVATTLVQIVVGPVSDQSGAKWGRRHPFILWMTLGCAVCNVAFAYAGNFPLLLLSFFGIQLLLNAATGPYQALLPDNVPASRHGLASAYMGVALLVGQLAGAAAIFSVKSVGMPAIIIGITGLLLASMAITVTCVPDRPAAPNEQRTVTEMIHDMTDWQIKQNPDFYGLLQSRFFINLCYSTVTAFILYYLKDTILYAVTDEKARAAQADQLLTQVLIAVTLSALVGTLIAGRLADRVSKKQIIYVSCAVLGAATLVFCLTSSFIWVLILAGVFGLGWGAFQAVDWAMACNLLPKGGTAKYMAVWHACLTLPQVVAPAFGIVADLLNKQFGRGIGWRAAMLSTVIYLIAGALLLMRVRERDTAG
ncbi:MAG: MFS transporter [Armatimonadetes bacterium]|nr:MFS transporter [Armatimonadota bacterium]